MNKTLVPFFFDTVAMGNYTALAGISALTAPEIQLNALRPVLDRNIITQFNLARHEFQEWQDIRFAVFEPFRREIEKRFKENLGSNNINDAIFVGLYHKGDQHTLLNLAAIKYAFPETMLVSINPPAQPFIEDYSLIAKTPSCNVTKSESSKAEWIELDSIPNRISEAELKRAGEIWKDFKTDYQELVVALVGGDIPGDILFTRRHVEELADNIHKKFTVNDNRIIILTSRRTPPFVKSILEEKLNWFQPEIYEIGQLKDKTKNESLLAGALHHARVIIVTADSMSMLSEAASAGKIVLSFYPSKILTPRHKRLYKHMFDKGHFIDIRREELVYEPTTTTTATSVVAAKIKNMALACM